MNITNLLPFQLDLEEVLQLLLWHQQRSHPWLILWLWHEHVYLQLSGSQHWEVLLCLSAYWSCKFSNVTNILRKWSCDSHSTDLKDCSLLRCNSMWHVRNLLTKWGILWRQDGPPNVKLFHTTWSHIWRDSAVCQSVNPITLQFFHTKPKPKLKPVSKFSVALIVSEVMFCDSNCCKQLFVCLFSHSIDPYKNLTDIEIVILL